MEVSTKAKLIRNFSRHAHLYDRYANVQCAIADALLTALPAAGRKSIFEIGCGTGHYTRLLRERYPAARLTACDFSAAMVEIAQQKLRDAEVEFVVGDAETMALDARYDLLTSNATLQWFEDLARALGRYRAALAGDGVLAFSTFGPETFRELDRCLRRALPAALVAQPSRDGGTVHRGGIVSAQAFLEKDRIAAMLRASFARVDVRELTIREEYPSLRDLLAKIKYTGARGAGLPGKALMPPRLLERVERAFAAEYGRVEATYQAFLFVARP